MASLVRPAGKSAEVERGGAVSPRHRLLVFVVAYNAEKTIREVLSRIPHAIQEEYDTEVLIIDDGSTDRTFERSVEAREDRVLPFPTTVLFNPVNLGYGCNQKTGFCYAIKNGFDFVALVHGDGQYAPEFLPSLIAPLRSGEADACFGSRMMTKGGALKGRMPFYKFIGNKILSSFQNRMLRTSLTEFHSGYRVYATKALRKVPFELNTGDFHFDTEIIIQFVTAELRIAERPIPTYYGDEICRVNGLKYAANVVRAVLKARAQGLGLLYDQKFDCAQERSANSQYQLKLGYESPHSIVLAAVSAESRVLDLGCAGGHLAVTLKRLKGCYVVGVDTVPIDAACELDQFHQYDLTQGVPNIPLQTMNYVLLLDVVEHLAEPEAFVRQLGQALQLTPNVRILVSTGNVGFIVTRLMLLLGQFNYGKRGILDMSHTRLFTFASLRRLFEQAGYEIIETRGVPGPFPLAFGDNWISRLLVRFNSALIHLSKGLFSYQIFVVVQPRPGVEALLQKAVEEVALRGVAITG